MSRVGLVSTFRFAPSDRGGEAAENGTSTADRCWSVLSSFLLFHLAKGVDHIFLYADADDEWNRVYVGELRNTISCVLACRQGISGRSFDEHVVS